MVYVGGEGVILIVQILVLEVVQKPVIVQIVFLILFLGWRSKYIFIILFLGWLKLLRLRPSIKNGINKV